MVSWYHFLLTFGGKIALDCTQLAGIALQYNEETFDYSKYSVRVGQGLTEEDDCGQ